MLLGRDAEKGAIDHLLADARTGISGVLLLRGEAGMGKTALLRFAADRAAGMRVLSARGAEAEVAIAFGGLMALLRPAIDSLDRLPFVQADALRSALALGPAVVAERLVIGAATLGLLAAEAETQPVLIALDDAQWLDEPSAEAILFAIRRFRVDPIAAVIAVRDGAPAPLGDADLPELALVGLDRDASEALLAHHHGAPVPREGADRLFRQTGGNPLALVELAHEASHVGADLVEGPLPASTSVERVFATRAARLSPAAQHCLLVAAAASTNDVGDICNAIKHYGLDPAPLTEAEVAGLICVDDGRLEFRHPLARSAVHNVAEPPERRAVHRALAEGLDPIRDGDRRAWHLAAAAFGPDDAVAQALADAARRARERGAYAVAAAAMVRAARLSTTPGDRALRLLKAASSAWLAGHTRNAVATLDDIGPDAADIGIGVDVLRLRAQIAFAAGRAIDAYDLLCEAATSAHDEPLESALLWADAAGVAIYIGRPRLALDAARAARAELNDDGDGLEACVVRLALGSALILAGQGADEGPRLLREAVAMPVHSQLLGAPKHPVRWELMGSLFLRETEAGRDIGSRCLAVARDRGAASMLPSVLREIGLHAATTDRWTEAGALLHESIQVADDTDQPAERGASLAVLTRLEARQGRAKDCRDHGAEVLALVAAHGRRLLEIWVLAAFGDLELAVGSAERALEHHIARDELLSELGIGDVDLFAAPDLAEAYLRLGDIDPARPAARLYRDRAATKGQPWALARASRTAGLLAADNDFDGHFDQALRFHTETRDAFEQARTELTYGERLRRVRRRADARVHLRAAFEAFERLGAVPWAERARLELASSGETARRRIAATLDQLTPRELQVALDVAAGATTRETAARLYLSPKTVEYHLRSVYRKLAISTRGELADALGSRDALT